MPQKSKSTEPKKFFSPTSALAKMYMYPMPGTSQKFLLRYSTFKDDRKGLTGAVSGLKRLAMSKSYAGKFKTIIIYENEESGLQLAKCVDQKWT